MENNARNMLVAGGAMNYTVMIVGPCLTAERTGAGVLID